MLGLWFQKFQSVVSLNAGLCSGHGGESTVEQRSSFRDRQKAEKTEREGQTQLPRDTIFFFSDHQMYFLAPPQINVCLKLRNKPST